MTAYQIGSILFTLGMLYCFVCGAREAWPAVDDRNCNDDAPEDGVARGVGPTEPVDGSSESEAAQVFLYHGEPWFAAASIQALAVQLAFIAAVAVVCFLIGSEVWTRATRWIDAHPYWAGASEPDASLSPRRSAR